MSSAVCLVDSFGPRRISNICGPQGWMTLGVSDRVWDAFGALAYLRSLPFIDPARIGVMGGHTAGRRLCGPVRSGCSRLGAASR